MIQSEIEPPGKLCRAVLFYTGADTSLPGCNGNPIAGSVQISRPPAFITRTLCFVTY